MGVTRVLHGCYKGVTRVLLGCYTTETHSVDSCLGAVKSRGTVVWRDNWRGDRCPGGQLSGGQLSLHHIKVYKRPISIVS